MSLQQALPHRRQCHRWAGTGQQPGKQVTEALLEEHKALVILLCLVFWFFYCQEELSLMSHTSQKALPPICEGAVEGAQVSDHI